MLLTTEKTIETSIKTVDDLVKQTDIQYGTTLGGSTMRFFKVSTYSYTTLMNNIVHARTKVQMYKATILPLQDLAMGSYEPSSDNNVLSYTLRRKSWFGIL